MVTPVALARDLYFSSNNKKVKIREVEQKDKPLFPYVPQVICVFK
jgi:hypothetical protein